MELLFIVLLLFIALPLQLNGQSLQVMTYNIRVDFPDTSVNHWENRKGAIAHLLNYYSPDIVGTQEGKLHQNTYLIEETGNRYAWSGAGRDDGKDKGEYCAIFYRKERFHLLKQGTFWLSDTPDTVSVGWDADLPRICSYVLLEDKMPGNVFWVFNTHFDHIGVQARDRSVDLILKKVSNLNSGFDYPVILLGDLNMVPEQEPIRRLRKAYYDTRELAEIEPYGPEATFNKFDFFKPPEGRIDYIFLSKKPKSVRSYRVIDDSNQFRFPSDHFPILIEIEF